MISLDTIRGAVLVGKAGAAPKMGLFERLVFALPKGHKCHHEGYATMVETHWVICKTISTVFHHALP